jgi:hypothetical protein
VHPPIRRHYTVFAEPSRDINNNNNNKIPENQKNRYERIDELERQRKTTKRKATKGMDETLARQVAALQNQMSINASKLKTYIVSSDHMRQIQIASLQN